MLTLVLGWKMSETTSGMALKTGSFTVDLPGVTEKMWMNQRINI